MGRSLIQTVNTGAQTVAEGGLIQLGITQRRYGCALRLDNDAIQATGVGYYSVDAAVTVTPTDVGAVTVELRKNGVTIPGAIGYGYAGTALTPVTVPIVATTRIKCAETDTLSLVLTAGAGTVNNVSVRVIKE